MARYIDLDKDAEFKKELLEATLLCEKLYNSGGTVFEGDNTFQVIGKCIEKQIPKKPMVRNYANWSGCECGMKIYEQFKYCPYCGQSILWE